MQLPRTFLLFQKNVQVTCKNMKTPILHQVLLTADGRAV